MSTRLDNWPSFQRNPERDELARGALVACRGGPEFTTAAGAGRPVPIARRRTAARRPHAIDPIGAPSSGDRGRSPELRPNAAALVELATVASGGILIAKVQLGRGDSRAAGATPTAPSSRSMEPARGWPAIAGVALLALVVGCVLLQWLR